MPLHVSKVLVCASAYIDAYMCQNVPLDQSGVLGTSPLRQLLLASHAHSFRTSNKTWGNPPRNSKSGPQSWKDLFNRKAIIHFPYEVSTMSIFEQYSAGAVLVFPSRRFFEELINNHLAVKAGKPPTSENGSLPKVSSVYWEQNTDAFRLKLPPDQLDKLPEFAELASKCKHVVEQQGEQVWAYTFGDPHRSLPDALKGTEHASWWLDRADFYDKEWMPGIKFFDSWEGLVELAVQVSLHVSNLSSHLNFPIFQNNSGASKFYASTRLMPANLWQEPIADERRQQLEFVQARNAKVYARWRELVEDAFPQLKGKHA
jgi:hypothetical protein